MENNEKAAFCALAVVVVVQAVRFGIFKKNVANFVTATAAFADGLVPRASRRDVQPHR